MMDTLFRFHHQHQAQAQAQAAASSSPDQQHQQSPYDSRSSRSTTTTSSSSHHTHNHSYYSQPHYNSSNNNSSNSDSYHYHHHHHYHQQPAAPYQEECGNDRSFYMDEDFSSSPSSRHFHSQAPPALAAPTQQPPPSSTSGPAPTPPLSTGGHGLFEAADFSFPPVDQQPPRAAPTQQPPPSSTSGPAPTPPLSTGGHGLFEAADFSFPPVDLSINFGSPASSSGTGGGTASSSGGGGVGRWAAQLLLECARAVAARDSQRVQQLMWMLNELASPYGDVDQKLASYFLQGIFARLTTSGPRTLRTLTAVSDRNTSFESTRRTVLKFQELSPWTSFGHVAANGAILESFLAAAGASSSSSQAQRLHILDLSNTFCTQWPTLLEALATRSSDETPHLSITTVVSTSGQSGGAAQRVMREIGQRLEKFARLMGVPFSFRVVHHAGDLAELDLDGLNLREGGATTALAVNCVNALRGVAQGGARRRDAFVASLRRLEPRVVTVVEEEADLVSSDASGEETDTEAAFMKVFGEGLRFFSAYMDSLEESFPKASNERLALERVVGRAIVDLLSCPASESAERRETGASWARRMRSSGFSPVAFSEDVADDVRSLLRRYREGWSLREASADDAAAAGVLLAWKEQAVVWASAWRP